MANKIGMWEGRVYGHEVSDYGKEHGYLDYRTMGEIVDDMVLCNDIIRNTWDACGEWELYNGSDYDEENDCYSDIYQEFIITNHGAKWLADHTDEIVYYNEQLDLNVWCITHWGTGWDYVLSDVKLIECETFKELCEFNYDKDI